MITKEQCRAARGLLGIKQTELANACGLSKTALTNFESGAIGPRQETLSIIRTTLEKMGVHFIGSTGVEKRDHAYTVLNDENALPDLWDDIFNTLKNLRNAEVLISHLDESGSHKKHPQKLEAHLKRLHEHHIGERLLACEGDSYFIQDPDCYRWLPKKVYQAGMTSFVYGGKVALQFWNKNIILIIQNHTIYEEEKQRFEYLWETAVIPPYKKLSEDKN